MRVYPLKKRLARLSEKGQRYVLRKIAAAGKTRAQTSYYRLKRDWLLGEVMSRYAVNLPQRIMRYGFGQNNTNWAHDIAVAENRVDPLVYIKIRTDELTDLANSFDDNHSYSELYRNARAQYAKAMDAVETGYYKDMTEEELQALFYTIGADIPRAKHKGCGRG